MAKNLIGNITGPSAYDVAKAAGFVGTEAQWLASLVGDVTPAATAAKTAAEAASTAATNAKNAAEAALVTVDQKVAAVPTPAELDATIDAATGQTLAVAPSMTQAEIQAVLTAAPAQSRVLFAPGTYALTGGLTCANDGIHLDASRATLTQATWGRPIFDLNGRNDITVDVGVAKFVGTRAGMGGSYRGSAEYVSGAAVWANGDRNIIRVRRSINLACPVFLSAWAGTSTYDRQGVGNRIRVDECEGFNFGVLWSWQKDLLIEDIYGHDDIDDSAGVNPTHVIYGSATHTFRDQGVTVLSARAENIRYGQPFQFKYSDRLTVRSHSAHASRGLVNFMDCHDLDADGIAGTQILANSGTGAFTMLSTDQYSQRPNVRNVSVQLAAGVDERGFLAISDDGEFANITVQSNHSATVSASSSDINVRGARNRLTAPRDRQIGAACWGILVGHVTPTTANDTIVEKPVVTGATVMVNVAGGSTGVVIDFDPEAQSVTSFVTATNGVGTETYSTRSRRPVALSTFGESSALNLFAATGTVTVGAANNALQRRIRPTRDIAVSGLRWWSVVVAGNYDIAILDDLSNKRLWSKGSTVWPAAGAVNETVTGVTLLAGRTYRIAFSSNDATATLRGVQSSLAGLDALLDGSTDTTTVTAAFPIPDPLVAGSSASTTRNPLIVVLGA